MAQHARPKVTGQIDERRAHCTIFSTVGGQNRNFSFETHSTRAIRSEPQVPPFQRPPPVDRPYALSGPQSSAPLRQT